MLRGVCTVTYQTDDLAGAKAWYTELLGVDPYFDTEAYVEFRIGDHGTELGLLDARFARMLGGEHGADRPAGVLTYWYVDDVRAAVERLERLGATVHQPVRDFTGEGFVGASVIDPFGNVLAVMDNPHYRALHVAPAADRSAAG